MALHFSANQYQDAFTSDRIQHWEVPHVYREQPRHYEGFSQIVANQHGHLLPGVKRSRASPWGPFVGTWDLPRQLPAISMAVKTARTQTAAEDLKKLKTQGDDLVLGRQKYTRFPEEKGYKLKKSTGIQRMLAQPPVDLITDVGLSQPAYPPDIASPPKSPVTVYQYPPMPNIKVGILSPREPKRNMVENVAPDAVNSNRNAVCLPGREKSLDSACIQKIQTDSSKTPIRNGSSAMSRQSANRNTNTSPYNISAPPSSRKDNTTPHRTLKSAQQSLQGALKSGQQSRQSCKARTPPLASGPDDLISKLRSTANSNRQSPNCSTTPRSKQSALAILHPCESLHKFPDIKLVSAADHHLYDKSHICAETCTDLVRESPFDKLLSQASERQSAA